MQGSYALLMLVYKTRVAISKDRATNVLYDEGHQSSEEQMLDGLSNGLERIVGVISNFSRAFEALSGMRGRSYLSIG
jgi:L-fucose isomerase-like protein